jgi:hypothetical protein
MTRDIIGMGGFIILAVGLWLWSPIAGMVVCGGIVVAVVCMTAQMGMRYGNSNRGR